MIVSSQTIVSDDKLDWLFERNDDAVYYKYVFGVCDSLNNDYIGIINEKDSIILSRDILVSYNDSAMVQLFNIAQEQTHKAAILKKRSKFLITITAIAAFILGIIA